MSANGHATTNPNTEPLLLRPSQKNSAVRRWQTTGAGAKTNSDPADDMLIESPVPSARAVADSGANVVELDAFLAERAAHQDELYRAVDSATHPEDRRSAARELAANPVEWMGYALMPVDELAVFNAAMADDNALDAAMSKMPLISLTKMHLYGPALAERVWRNTVPDADMKYAERLMAAEDTPQAIDALVYQRQMQETAASRAAPAAKPKNGYITTYRGQKLEVYANTSYEAQQIATAQIQKAWPRSRIRSSDVEVYLAELAGEPVTTTITN